MICTIRRTTDEMDYFLNAQANKAVINLRYMWVYLVIRAIDELDHVLVIRLLENKG